MFKHLGKILLRLQGGTAFMLFFAAFLLLVWGSFAPVGTLVWWLDRGEEEIDQRTQEVISRANREGNTSESSSSKPACYIVFLTGVGDMTADELASGEEKFLDRLEAYQPDCVTVRNVFPYSAANEDIAGQSVFEFLWEFVEEAEGWLELTKYALQMRNVWRMAISADNRYGPVFNQAIALAIAEQMDNEKPLADASEQPMQVFLMGTSGGVQVALGAADYLEKWLPAEIVVVSFGGFFNGNEGFNSAEKVYHLNGEDDLLARAAGVVFPSRWRWTFGSPYNRARRQERYQVYTSGPHSHQGDTGYFGEETAEAGKTYLDITLEQVKQLPIWSRLEPESRSQT